MACGRRPPVDPRAVLGHSQGGLTPFHVAVSKGFHSVLEALLSAHPVQAEASEAEASEASGAGDGGEGEEGVDMWELFTGQKIVTNRLLPVNLNALVDDVRLGGSSWLRSCVAGGGDGWKGRLV
jgi:hypothetical protein